MPATKSSAHANPSPEPYRLETNRYVFFRRPDPAKENHELPRQPLDHARYFPPERLRCSRRTRCKVLHHIPAVQGKLGSLKLYNALAQEFDNRLDSAAAERGLSLFAEHTADARTNPGKHPNIDLLFKVKTENLVLQLRPVEARS